MNKLLVVLAALAPLPAQTVQAIAPARELLAARRVPVRAGQPVPVTTASAQQDLALARVMAGGGWETTEVLVNRGSTALTFRQYFWGADGRASQFTVSGQTGGGFTASAFQSTLSPNSSVTLVLADNGSPLEEGWSSLSYDSSQGKLGGYAMIRHRGLGGMSFEATVPFSGQQDYSLYLPFDNTSGFRTQVTLVNPASNLVVQVLLTYLDPQGKLMFIDSVSLNPGQQMTLSLPDLYPDLANKAGTISVEASLDRFSVVGLRYNDAYGAVTTIPGIN